MQILLIVAILFEILELGIIDNVSRKHKKDGSFYTYVFLFIWNAVVLLALVLAVQRSFNAN